MAHRNLTRRDALVLSASVLFSSLSWAKESMAAQPDQRYDFRNRSLDGWSAVSGQWAIEDLRDDPQNSPALVQRATNNDYNVIVAPAGPFSDFEASVRFKPISGREDASGGITFRFAEGRYYVVRGNALEDNFRSYIYDKSRSQLASARVAKPALGRWHTIRVSAVGDRIQAWLNDSPVLDHRDKKLSAGKVGLWTKADSVTAFKDLIVTPKGS
jgi:hypothetical protein